MKVRIAYIGFLLCLSSVVSAQNQAGQLAFKLMDLYNPWSASTNPMAYHLKDSLALSQIDLGIRQQMGLFKPSYDGEDFQQFAFHTEGRRKFAKANLYGDLQYNNQGVQNVYGTNVQNTLKIYPYTINDTVGFDFYSGESFHFEFGLDYEYNEKLHWGFGLSYSTQLSSQDNDPRPKNNTLDLVFQPGIMLKLGRTSLGFNLDYQYYNEDIDIITIQKNSYHTLFLQHGLGNFFFTKTDQHFRIYNQNTYGSAIQFHYNKDGFSSFSTFGISTSTLFVHDSDQASWAQIKTDACLDALKIDIKQRFNWEKENSLQTVSISYKGKSDLGTEYIQRLVLEENGIQNWVTFDKSQLYYSNFNSAALGYQWLRNNKSRPKGLLEAQINYTSHREKYLKPEYKMEYTFVQPDISYTYIIHLKNIQLSLLAKGLYHKNLTANTKLPTNSITQKIITPDFEFVSADYYSYGFSTGFDFIPLKSKLSYFLNAQFQRFEPLNDTRFRNFFGLNMGILF